MANPTVNDDAATPAVPGQNQNAQVLPVTSVPVNVSSSGAGQGSSASPGPSGVTSTSLLPGRRTYNPLSKLSNYTYNLSLYMITPDAYDAFILSGRKKIDALSQAKPMTEVGPSATGGAFLIAQSGGINNKTTSRAPGFELDYYIDNVKFTTSTTGQDTGTAAFTQNLTLTITEPYGFSFLTNLKRALTGLQEYAGSTTYKANTNSLRQFFILGIRFYGYDSNGNLVKGTDYLDGVVLDPENGTEALFERFYDLQFQTIKFNIGAKSTVYTITATNPGAQTMLGTKRGRCINGARCVGSTVEEMLKGPDGLLARLNKEQEDQVKKNPQDRKIANRYDIKFLADAQERIAEARMVLASDLNKWRWPGSKAENTTAVNDSTGIKALPDSNAREMSFNSDTAIIQAISTIVQHSSYMEEALSIVYSNVLQPDGKQKNVEQIKKERPQPISWFNVSAELSEVEWDDLICDWAYKTTFIVTVYDVPGINTPFITDPQTYYGPHKYFNYTFTGLNTEVLDFNLTFNNSYMNLVLTTPFSINAGDTKLGTSGGQTAITPGMRSGGDTTGSLNTAGEAQASVVTLLTSPEAYTNGNLSILGDPDFLMRDQVSSLSNLYEKFYGSDGFTISAHGGDVFVEVILKESQDYNHNIGVQELNESIIFQPYPKQVADIAKGIIYKVQNVTTTFSSGKFTQNLSLLGGLFWGTDSSGTGTTAQTEQGGREAQNTNASGTANSGASSNNTNATSANTGQRPDPKLATQTEVGPINTISNYNTVGNPSPQTVNATTGQVADDDSQPDFKRVTTNDADGGRELVIDSFDAQREVEVNIGPPVLNLGGG